MLPDLNSSVLKLAMSPILKPLSYADVTMQHFDTPDILEYMLGVQLEEF